MKILLCGASGFIGRHLARHLQQAGHQVWHGQRQRSTDPGRMTLAIDYRQLPSDAAQWQALLRPHGQPFDVVINAVGILNPQAGGDFAQIQQHAPIALFEGCIAAGVARFIQISALAGQTVPGSLPNPQSNPQSAAWADASSAAQSPALPDFIRTKHAADAHMLTRQAELPVLVVRPSLLVGEDGASSQLFRSLASLPWLVLPGRGEQQVQPLHIDDLCAACVAWLAQPVQPVHPDQSMPRGLLLEAVGPRPLSYRAMLEQYRAELGLPLVTALSMPLALLQTAATLAGCLPLQWRNQPGSLAATLSPATLLLLQQHNTGNPAQLTALLGHAPRWPWNSGMQEADAIAHPGPLWRQAAVNRWSNPLLRASLAVLWLVTALLSFGLYPEAGSLALLAPLGLPLWAARVLLYGAASLDLLLGLATLLWPSRRLWLVQIGLILGYTLIISLTLPAFWLHPFGPILKNLPILAILIHLLALESKP